MKMTASLLMTCFLCLACDVCSAQVQLLKNPSFEEAGSASDLAAHWNRWGQWMNREDSWKPTHGGTAMIGYHHWRIESAADSGLWQDAKVTPGGQYTFSIYMTQDADPGSASAIEVALESTVDGKQVTIARKTYRPTELATGEKWSRLTISGAALNDTLRVLVRITPSAKGPRGGAIKLDDASLVAR